MPKDDDITPVESISAMYRLGLAVCPCCEGSGARDGASCPYCEGSKRVTVARRDVWIGLRKTDPAPEEP
jgi:DnaJ-class molecular chaperone